MRGEEAEGEGLKTIASAVNFKVALDGVGRRCRGGGRRFTGCWVSKVVHGVARWLRY